MSTDLSPEYASLGGLLLAPKTLAAVQRWLRPDDFAAPATRLTYSLILSMDARQVPVDPVTAQDEMRRQGLLRRDGYPTMELVRMVEAVPVPAATGYYVRLVLSERSLGVSRPSANDSSNSAPHRAIQPTCSRRSEVSSKPSTPPDVDGTSPPASRSPSCPAALPANRSC